MWATDLEQAGADTADTIPPILTAPVVADTKGAYVEVIASTSFVTAFLQMSIGFIGSGVGTHDIMYDLSTGAAAAEVVLVADLLCSLNNRAMLQQNELLVAVPSSTRLSSRVQTTTAASGSQQGIQVALFENADIIGDAPTTYGSDTSDTSGVSITDGAANVKGAYAELTGSTGGAHNHFGPSLGYQDRLGGLTNHYLFDLATGAAAAEVVFIANFYFRISSSGVPTNAGVWNFGVPEVASSTRIAARMQTAALGVETIDMICICTNAQQPSGGGETSHVF